MSANVASRVLCTNLKMHPVQVLHIFRHALQAGNLSDSLRAACDLVNSGLTRDVWREMMLTVFDTGMPFFHRDLAEVVDSDHTLAHMQPAPPDSPSETQLIFSTVRNVVFLPKTPLTKAIGVLTAWTSTGLVPSDVCHAAVPEPLQSAFPEIKDDLIRALATCFVQNIHDCCTGGYSAVRELLAVQCAMHLVVRGYGRLLWQNLIIETLVSTCRELLEYLGMFTTWMTIYTNLTPPSSPGTTEPRFWCRSRNIIITVVAIMVRRFGQSFPPGIQTLVPPQDMPPEEIALLGSATLSDFSMPLRYMIGHAKAVLVQEVLHRARSQNQIQPKNVPEIFELRRTELEMLFNKHGSIRVAAYLMERYQPNAPSAIYSETHPTTDGFLEIMTGLDMVCHDRLATAKYTLSIRKWLQGQVRFTTFMPHPNGPTYESMLGTSAPNLETTVLRTSTISLTSSIRLSDASLDGVSDLPEWARAYDFIDWAAKEEVPEVLRPYVPADAEYASVAALRIEGFRRAKVTDPAMTDFPDFFCSTQKFLVFRLQSASDASAYARAFTYRHVFFRMFDPDGLIIQCMVPIVVRSLVMISFNPEAIKPAGLPPKYLAEYSPVPFAMLCILSRACNWTVPATELLWTPDQNICVIPPYASKRPGPVTVGAWKEKDLPFLLRVVDAIVQVSFEISQQGLVAENGLLNETRLFLRWIGDQGDKTSLLVELNKVLV